MSVGSKIVIGFIISVCIGAGIYWAKFQKESVFLERLSSDGKIKVQLYRKAVKGYPFVDGVDVSVKVDVVGYGGSIVSHVDKCDRWVDAEVMFSNIIIDDKVVKIGPQYWNGSSFGYYEIKLNK